MYGKSLNFCVRSTSILDLASGSGRAFSGLQGLLPSGPPGLAEAGVPEVLSSGEASSRQSC